MNKLFYCKDCLRVVREDGVCTHCKGQNLKELVVGAPVNILGSKLKGKVLKIKDGVARILITDETKNKYIKEFDADKLKKVI